MMGKLVVIWGSMFSGKTEELLRRLNRAMRAGKKVQLFKPKVDNRAGTCVRSHAGREAEAVVFEKPGEIINLLEPGVDVVGIDEVQFAGTEIVRVVKDLLFYGIDVICSGLDMSYRAEPFPVTMHLAAFSHECVKLSTVCAECGDDAWVTHRKSEEDALVVIGGADKYAALCMECRFKAQKGREGNSCR